MWNNSYRTPTERWQKTSGFPKGKKLLTYPGRAKEKTETKEYGRDLHQWEGAGKEERLPHTRKPLRGRGDCGGRRGKLRSRGGQHSHRGAEGRVARFLHRESVLTGTQPAREACLLTRRGGRGCELRPGLRSAGRGLAA